MPPTSCPLGGWRVDVRLTPTRPRPGLPLCRLRRCVLTGVSWTLQRFLHVSSGHLQIGGFTHSCLGWLCPGGRPSALTEAWPAKEVDPDLIPQNVARPHRSLSSIAGNRCHPWSHGSLAPGARLSSPVERRPSATATFSLHGVLPQLRA